MLVGGAGKSRVGQVTRSPKRAADTFLGGRRVSELGLGRYLFPTVIPPAFPVVNEDLPKTITAILRWRMKQQESHLFAGGDDQHLLAGVSESAIIADRDFGLLGVVQSLVYADSLHNESV